MPQTLLEMAKDLVAEQIRARHLAPDDIQSLLSSTYATLLSLHQTEAPDSDSVSSQPHHAVEPKSWKGSITKNAVTCLECGNSFRQLSARHLRIHGLDSHSYRMKYGIPSTQPLASRSATARRRELAQRIRPWEQAAAKRANAKAQAQIG
ncbi:MAG: hypothetical protein ETSY1_41285 [Candidatus Entotheonella factor]|uniref:MucR family transcriptional regulator n=1 Tax=Entotheonella factor TaxID=1429438 RepID=W4L4E8_ENTF1|nr:MAG: hypothetical protein ETSY1_41285 [Candidatus Entotheonella factor]